MPGSPLLQQPLRKSIQARTYTNPKPAFELEALLEMPQNSPALDGREVKRLETTHHVQVQHAPSDDEPAMFIARLEERRELQQAELDMAFRGAVSCQ